MSAGNQRSVGLLQTIVLFDHNETYGSPSGDSLMATQQSIARHMRAGRSSTYPSFVR
jgi:hypothetical protein